MVLPGETVATGAPMACLDCKKALKVRVCKSAAGYYVGFLCPDCGPHSRESGYYKTEKEAEEALYSGKYERD